MASLTQDAHAMGTAEEVVARPTFYRCWPLVGACLAAGITLSVVLGYVLSQRENRLQEARFHLDAERQADRIHHRASDVVTGVRVLRAFFAGSEQVDEHEFRIFTEPLNKAAPTTLLFGSAAMRADANGREVFPVELLSQPAQPYLAAGSDLASEPVWRAALEGSLVTDGVTASSPFLPKGAQSSLVLLVAPVPDKESDDLVFGLFSPAELLDSALWPQLAEAMHVRLLDTQHPESPVLLAEHRGNDSYPRAGRRLPVSPFLHQFQVGGREWLVECRPTVALLERRRAWLPWAAAATGILLTLAGAGILVLLMEQTSRVERLVAVRTDEVKQSEQRLRTITGAALDAVVMMAPDGTVAHWNPAAERMFGFRRDEILGRNIHATLVPEEYRERATQALHRFAATGQGEAVGRLIELEALRKDGTRFPMEISVAAIPMNGQWGAVAIVRDITERRTAEETVRREQKLLRQMLEFQERERKLMAYEIHDGLVQQMTGAHLTFQSLPQAPGGDDTSARDRFEAASGLLRDAIAEARRVISGLRPPVLDESGIEPAVNYLVDQHRRRGGPKIEFASNLGSQRFAPLVETAAFRIAQEGLGNACRHSRSERIRLALHTDGKHISIEICDWGEGFDPAQVGAGHFGLQGIRERARLLRGNAEIQSAPGQGTSIRVTLPAQAPANGD